jgi:hypothetical protein
MADEFRDRTRFLVKNKIEVMEKKSNDMNKGITSTAEYIEQGIEGIHEIKFERDQGLIIAGETVGNSVYSHSMLGTGRSITGTPPLVQRQQDGEQFQT